MNDKKDNKQVLPRPYIFNNTHLQRADTHLYVSLYVIYLHS